MHHKPSVRVYSPYWATITAQALWEAIAKGEGCGSEGRIALVCCVHVQKWAVEKPVALSSAGLQRESGV